MKWEDLKPEWIGGAVGAALVGVVRALGPLIARTVTRTFERNVKELDAMDSREREEKHAAELFAAHAENAQLRGDITRMAALIAQLERERDEADARALSAVESERELREGKYHAEKPADTRTDRGTADGRGPDPDGSARTVRPPRRPQGR